LLLPGAHADLRSFPTRRSSDLSIPLLEQLIGTEPHAEVDELVRVGLFEPDGQPDEVWFSHALIQEVAYGSLLKRRRRELHAAARSEEHTSELQSRVDLVCRPLL